MGKIPIQYVLNRLGISYPIDREGFDTICPKCGNGKKLHISLSKEVFHCFKCSSKGGAVTLYALFMNISVNTAKKELLSGDKERDFKYVPKLQLPKQKKRADIGVRHQAYNSLLSLLTLSKEHTHNLLARGLTLESIDRCQFKSTVSDQNEAKRLVSQLISQGCQLEGVPGFYSDDYGNTKMVTSKSGIYIPVRGASNLHRIQALQIRLDEVVDKKKFITFSSSQFPNGAGSSAAFMHFSGTGLPGGELYITEGPIKADIANQITGKSFLALTGVNSIHGLKKQLEGFINHPAFQLRKIYVCLDMDYATNDNVQKALDNIMGICASTDLPVKQLNWDPQFKGIDDYLVGRKKIA